MYRQSWTNETNGFCYDFSKILKKKRERNNVKTCALLSQLLLEMAVFMFIFQESVREGNKLFIFNLKDHVHLFELRPIKRCYLPSFTFDVLWVVAEPIIHFSSHTPKHNRISHMHSLNSTIFFFWRATRKQSHSYLVKPCGARCTYFSAECSLKRKSRM